MFEEAGLHADQPPETWDDLVTYGRRLVRRDPEGNLLRSGLNIPVSGTNASKWFRLFTVQSGFDPFGDELESVTLLDDRIVEAVTFFSDLFHTHRVTDPGAGGTFGAGTTAMQWDRVRPYEELLGPDARYIRSVPVYIDAIRLMMEHGHVSSAHYKFFELRGLQDDIMKAVLDPLRAPRIVLEEQNSRFLELRK